MKTEIHQHTNTDHHTISTEQYWFNWKASFRIKVVNFFNWGQDNRLLNSFYNLSCSWMQKTELSLLLSSLINHQNWVHVHIRNDFNHVSSGDKVWSFYNKKCTMWRYFCYRGKWIYLLNWLTIWDWRGLWIIIKRWSFRESLLSRLDSY